MCNFGSASRNWLAIWLSWLSSTELHHSLPQMNHIRAWMPKIYLVTLVSYTWSRLSFWGQMVHSLLPCAVYLQVLRGLPSAKLILSHLPSHDKLLFWSVVFFLLREELKQKSHRNLVIQVGKLEELNSGLWAYGTLLHFQHPLYAIYLHFALVSPHNAIWSAPLLEAP